MSSREEGHGTGSFHGDSHVCVSVSGVLFSVGVCVCVCV